MHDRAKRITWTIAIALAVLSGGCHAGRGPSHDVRTVEPRVDLEMITGRLWVLDAWREGEPASPEPEVSLRYAAGSLTGRAGCNRYTAPVERRPGLGSIAATRMMCPPPIITTESRFLESLARTKAIELQGPKLRLVYTPADGGEAKMSFRPQ